MLLIGELSQFTFTDLTNTVDFNKVILFCYMCIMCLRCFFFPLCCLVSFFFKIFLLYLQRTIFFLEVTYINLNFTMPLTLWLVSFNLQLLISIYYIGKKSVNFVFLSPFFIRPLFQCIISAVSEHVTYTILTLIYTFISALFTHKSLC